MIVEEIMNEIAIAIKAVLPDATFYKEDVESGLKVPAVFIFPITSEYNRLIGGKEFTKVSFSVTYIPKSEKGRMESADAMEKMLKAVRNLKTFRTMDRQGEYDEETSKITFDVPVRELKVEDVELMRRAEINIKEV
uniref:Tail completion protein n=1 Tax=Siphoviridae sp. ctdd214 TaxID=2825581 RepID=A0A8S5V5X0_9CAUD|nr:MAG TPA: tail completion protein [Siphoviridae sp. ctdd214]